MIGQCPSVWLLALFVGRFLDECRGVNVIAHVVEPRPIGGQEQDGLGIHGVTSFWKGN